MLLVDVRNQEKFEKYIRDFIPMRTEVFLKFMGITDIKKMPEDDEWIEVSSAGIFPERDAAVVARRYELISVDYINTKDELVTVDLSGTYGIEIKEQLKHLQDFDCDMIQGYYFSKPLPEEDFIKLLQG